MTQTEYEGRLYINGEFRGARSGRRFDVINPADESILGTVPHASRADLDAALTAAEEGFRVWWRTASGSRRWRWR